MAYLLLRLALQGFNGNDHLLSPTWVWVQKDLRLGWEDWQFNGYHSRLYFRYRSRACPLLKTKLYSSYLPKNYRYPQTVYRLPSLPWDFLLYRTRFDTVFRRTFKFFGTHHHPNNPPLLPSPQFLPFSTITPHPSPVTQVVERTGRYLGTLKGHPLSLGNFANS